ncbi:MAG TPA: hypothetical protein VH497_17635 [Vicinamibacterales bacterium]|jgi:hypothetical protein
MRQGTRLVVLAAILGTSGCAPSVDLMTALQIDGLSTGWFDAGYADGLNKITPSISFKLTNTSPTVLGPLHVNAVFRQAGKTAEWSARFVPVAGSQGLAAGKSSTLNLTADLGYTSFDPVEDMLENSHFVDADVDVYARYGSSEWVRLARYRIDRHLLHQ